MLLILINSILLIFRRMIDFGKLYCHLHPSDLITNFCKKQSCLIGLCASCICTHTQQHMSTCSTPHYQNIRTTYISTHQQIRQSISNLDTQKSRIQKINSFIHSKRKCLKDNVQQIKQQTIQQVRKFFQKKQEFLIRLMEQEQKKLGLHGEGRMDSLMNNLNREVGTLLMAAQELNSHNFLQSYQRIKTQTLAYASKLGQQVAKQLTDNQNFLTVINSKNGFIDDVLKSLEQSLILSFKINNIQTISDQTSNQTLKNTSNTTSDKRTSRFGGKTDQNKLRPVYRSESHQKPQDRRSLQRNANMIRQVQNYQLPTSNPKVQQTAKSIIFDTQYQPQTSFAQVSKQMSQSLIVKQNPSSNLTHSNFFPNSKVSKDTQPFHQKDMNQWPQYQSISRFEDPKTYQMSMLKKAPIDKHCYKLNYKKTPNQQHNVKAFNQQQNVNMVNQLQNVNMAHQQNLNNTDQQNFRTVSHQQNVRTANQQRNGNFSRGESGANTPFRQNAFLDSSRYVPISSSQPKSINSHEVQQQMIPNNSSNNMSHIYIRRNQTEGSQNFSMLDGKRVRKSGLSLFKSNHSNISLVNRTILH